MSHSLRSYRRSHAYAKVFQTGHIELLAPWKGSASGMFQNTADAFDRGIVIIARIMGEELDDNVILPALNDTQAVCECTSSVLRTKECMLVVGGKFDRSDCK